MQRRRVVHVCATVATLAACGSPPTEPFGEAADPTRRPTPVVTDTLPAVTVDPSLDPPAEPDVAIGPMLLTATQPVDVISDPASDREYLVGRLGTLQRIVGLDGPDPELAEVVLDITASLQAGFEEGLLAATFAPDGRAVYLNTVTGGVTEILEFQVDADGAIDASSRRVVYTFEQLAVPHNGGSLLFGPDGYLYVFLGDGGMFEGWAAVAQDLSRPFGKILRIDPTPSGAAAFTVPADNPFVDEPGALPEIWALGVRNPWRASFDPMTGDMWFGDVGDFDVEEINVARAATGGGRGVSFGWPAWEGFDRRISEVDPTGHESPFHVYRHGDDGCSVIGGHVYRGSIIPDLNGWYVFGDWCSGRVWAIDSLGFGLLNLVGEVPGLASISVDARGELYAVSVNGPVHRIVPAG